jgi:hypothetical protein
MNAAQRSDGVPQGQLDDHARRRDVETRHLVLDHLGAAPLVLQNIRIDVEEEQHLLVPVVDRLVLQERLLAAQLVHPQLQLRAQAVVKEHSGVHHADPGRPASRERLEPDDGLGGDAHHRLEKRRYALVLEDPPDGVFVRGDSGRGVGLGCGCGLFWHRAPFEDKAIACLLVQGDTQSCTHPTCRGQ